MFASLRQQKKTRWYGHEKRMGSEKISKVILEWNAGERRRKEKPRKQWMNGVKRNMINKYFTEEGAEDSSLWRRKISLE